MALRFSLLLLAFPLVFAGAGCRSTSTEKAIVPADEEVPELLPPTREVEVGKISLVRAASGFVLIESVGKTPIPPGSILEARGESGVAKLRLDKKRQKEYLIADILEGTVRAGSPVFLVFPEQRTLPVIPEITAPTAPTNDQ